MTLIPWKKSRERDEWLPASLFDRFFNEPFFTGSWNAPALATPMDIAESDKEFTLKLEVPGMNAKDFEIEVNDGALTIRGEKKEVREERDGQVYRQERAYGAFRRTVELGSAADPAKIDAEYDAGILTVRIGKRPGAQPKRIDVKVKGK